MSFLVRGMEMPEDCAMLLKIFPDGRVGVPVHLTWMGTMVVNDAEAVPVPPHGRLIDADAIIEQCHGHNSQRTMWSEIEYLIDNAPTIIEADGAD